MCITQTPGNYEQLFFLVIFLATALAFLNAGGLAFLPGAGACLALGGNILLNE
jgi:hypothetical protein